MTNEAEEFVGVAEIATMLQVARNSAWRYTRRSTFPNPSHDQPRALSGDDSMSRHGPQHICH